MSLKRELTHVSSAPKSTQILRLLGRLYLETREIAKTKTKRMTMRTAILLLLAIASHAYAQDTYLNGDTSFRNIKNVNQQAESWGTCVAAYEIAVTLYEGDAKEVKKFQDLANGAKLSVIMTHVSDSIEKDTSVEAFDATWVYSRTLGDSISATRKTSILADAEKLGDKGLEEYLLRLAATLKVCASNTDAQQTYIYLWRSLVKSGLLTFDE